MHRARARGTTRTSASSSSSSSISSLRPPPLPALPPRAQKQYIHVQSKINSGLTVAKVQTITLRQYVQRRQEAFARVSPAQLRALLLEYEDEEGEDSGNGDVDGRGGGGGGGGPCIVTYGSHEEALYAKPFLVLDVREPSFFPSQTTPPHIAHTRFFSLAHLHQGKFTDDMRRFRNVEGTLLILYDQDERAGLAASMATQLVERGWENVYVLTGGLAAFVEIAPEWVEGGGGEGKTSSKKMKEVVEKKDEETDTVGLSAFALGRLPWGRGGGEGGARGYGNGNSSPRSTLASRSEKNWYSESVVSGVSSRSTTVSVADTVIQQAQAKKGSY